ncbi:MAG: SoxR reducing system RseC family protein [Bacteroidales bacterium]|nr:SoxR reducing system RseC family protein [Bacteroidales bacterium]
MEEQVSHPGVVVGIGEQDLEIEILSASSCGACNIKSACGMSEMKEKRLTVPKPADREFIVGQPVSIIMSTRQGNKAALIAYFIPTLIIISLTVVLSSFIKEWLAALAGIGAMAVYYFVLYYFFRDKLRNEFTYEIR